MTSPLADALQAPRVLQEPRNGSLSEDYCLHDALQASVTSKSAFCEPSGCMGFVPDDKAKGRQLQGNIATGFRVEHFAGKLLVGGTVSGEHLDGVQDVDLRFKVLCSLGPAGIQARMRRPSSAEARHGA